MPEKRSKKKKPLKWYEHFFFLLPATVTFSGQKKMERKKKVAKLNRITHLLSLPLHFIDHWPFNAGKTLNTVYIAQSIHIFRWIVMWAE